MSKIHKLPIVLVNINKAAALSETLFTDWGAKL